MTEWYERAGELAQSAVQRLHVRSALNPMLWLSGITAPLCFSAAYVFREIPTLRDWLVVVGVFPIGITCLGFVGFALFRPEKLQSEDYQIRHESLQLIQQKAGRLPISPTSIEAIANPDTPRLGSGDRA